MRGRYLVCMWVGRRGRGVCMFVVVHRSGGGGGGGVVGGGRRKGVKAEVWGTLFWSHLTTRGGRRGGVMPFGWSRNHLLLRWTRHLRWWLRV